MGLFKSNNNYNNNRGSVTSGQELVDMRSYTGNKRRSVVNTGLIYIDIATGQIPIGVQILNMNLSFSNSTSKQKFQKIIIGEQ